MTGAGGPRLVVDADLTVHVSDPQGRTAAVVVDDHDGAVRVRVRRVSDLRVVLASLPTRRTVGQGAQVLAQALRAGPGAAAGRWDQDVEVVVGGRTYLRRRAGRWQPTSTTVLPAVAAVGSVVVVAGVVLAVLGRLVRGLVGRG